MNTIPRLTIPAMMLLLAGCASVQYSALEKVGIHKRDILVERVEDAQQAQTEVKVEVKSAYEQFATLVNVEGGDLERKYTQLNGAVEDARDSIDDVDNRIRAIERVARDLFDEWRDELKQYSNANLRRSSETKLKDTQTRYKTMLASMKRARARSDPVMNLFEDQVLFLKHNLNARAVAALKGEAGSIERRVEALIRDMEAAIAEADRFVRTMR